jgi:hypothetical protein
MPRLKNRRLEGFCREIAAMVPYDLAYVNAGYADTKWARYNANRLAHRPAIAARINELRDEFDRTASINADFVRAKLLELVTADVKDLYEICPETKQPRLRAITDIPRRISCAITRIKLDQAGQPVEVALSGKVEAAAALLRSLPGGSQEQHVHAHVTEIGQRLSTALARVNEPRQIEAAPGDDFEFERAAEAEERLPARV